MLGRPRLPTVDQRKRTNNNETTGTNVTTIPTFEKTALLMDITAFAGHLPPARPAGSPERGRCPTVLVIDDDPLVRMVIEAALESFGEFDIWTAGDGATGLDLFYEARPDYVFLDLLIPGKNGFAVLEELQSRGNAVLDGVRLVVTSGLMGPSTLERLASLGAPEILPKPFRLNDLRRIVVGTLDGVPVAAG